MRAEWFVPELCGDTSHVTVVASNDRSHLFVAQLAAVIV